MKPKFLLIAGALMFISFSSFAKIWRVNNNSGVSTNFTELSTAISSTLVSNGDTIYVEGSSTTYANVGDVNKTLVIIGPGYFLSNWTNPVQYNSSAAKFSQIVSTANNVRIMGLSMDYMYLSGSGSEVSRCNISAFYFYQAPSNNVSVRQNWLGSIGSYSGLANTNLRIANNIILYGCTFYGNDNGIIEHNIFNLVNGYTLAFGNGTFNFEKNIISGTAAYMSGQTNVVFKYNMAASSILPTTGFNQNSINMTNNAVFVNNNYTANNDQYFMLSAGSPALTAGPSNTAIGPYGGATPYVASGIPAIPTIYDITIPQSTITGSSVSVKFSSKSNN